MARKQETMTFSGALEPLTQKPLDGRRKVNLISDLTEAASFPYIFSGLDVYCEENQKWYTFLGGDQTDIANWREEGSGGGGSTDWSDISNKPNFATVATSGSYNDLSDKPTIPSAYDDTALSERVTANTTAIADRYTKTETDGKIAEAMTDVDVEHFHVVTTLPPVADAKENHEYVLVTYEQDGTTIATEEHYLFYDGAFHSRPTQISLDGYATEEFVNNAFTQHVKTDVPVNAVFTDTVYDDTALAARVTEVEGQHIELTQAQYTALSEEEKNNGKVYFITDGGYYVPAVDIIPHAQQEPIIVGKFDLRGDGEYRNVYRIRKWIGDLKNASGIITAGWTETGVYIRPLRIYGSFTFHDYENTQTSWRYIIQQFPIPYSGYEPKEAPSGEKIGLKFYVDHNNKLNMVVDGQSYFNQDDFAQVIIDYIETPIT